MSPTFFRAAADFRRWLVKHHATTTELWLGFYNKASGCSGLTHPDALDQALCFGWIDGVRYKVDDVSYMNRFTPRRPGSNWSLVNVRHVARLKKAGLMAPAGLKAFAARPPATRTGGYSFESRPKQLPRAYATRLRANRRAWMFFTAQPPWYQRICAFWIVSAKQAATRERRLATLIADSSAGRRIRPLAGPRPRSDVVGGLVALNAPAASTARPAVKKAPRADPPRHAPAAES